MPATLTTHAKEKSSYVVTVSFTDEDGSAVIPNTIVWSLTDTAGTVVNSRSGIAVVTPAVSVDILLKDDDLALLAGEANQGIRVFTVEAEYDSVALGNNLPLKASVRFIVDNLLVIS